MWRKIRGLLNRNNIPKYFLYKVFKPKLKFFKENMQEFVIHFKKEYPFRKYVSDCFSEDINKGLNRYSNTEELEYLLEYNCKCYVEPRYGWLISGNKVYNRSLPYGIDLITPLPHYIYYKRKKRKVIKEGLPLFYNWFNYWHFYNDVIGSLMVLDKLKFDKSVPILVPSRALQVQYVKDFFETDYAKRWNWLFVGPQDFVYLDKAFIVKCFANVKEQFLLANEIFKSERKQGNKKIFIGRKGCANGRFLLNKEDILPVIKDFGFETIYTEGMSIAQQKEIFETATVILGIHGAGLTNMFFRFPEKCTILELFPKGKYPIHYYWLAKELGFQYDAICGENNIEESFMLDKNKLILFLAKNN